MAKKLFIAVVALITAAVLILATGFYTYRMVMLNLSIEQDEECYYVTVFDSTDVYTK